MQKNNLFWKNKTKMLTAFQNLYRLAAAMKLQVHDILSGYCFERKVSSANRFFILGLVRLQVFKSCQH